MSLFAARPQRRLKPPGPPPVPTTYEYLTDFIGDLTSSKSYTWTASVTGWYKIFAWGGSGKGGNGGNGAGFGWSGTAYTISIGGAGGPGGGTGGFSASLVYLEAGESVIINMPLSQTYVEIPQLSLLMTATAGSAATNSAANNVGKVGYGGVATGGNIINLPGADGGLGGVTLSTSSTSTPKNGIQGGNNGALGGTATSGSTAAYCYGSAGGGGARAVGEDYCKYVAPNMSAYKGGNSGVVGSGMPSITPGASIIITGSGSGGGGGYVRYSPETAGNGAAGGIGQPGVVIIEKGVA